MVKPDNIVNALIDGTDGTVYADEGLSDLTSVGQIITSGTIIDGALVHGSLADLDVDDHEQYILVTGTRSFTDNISTTASAPTLGSHLARKDYVDSTAGGGGGGGGTVSNALIGADGITVTSGDSIDTISGHISYTQDANDALIGGTNVTVTSGSNIITIDASGSFSNESDIDAINTVTGSLTLAGADGIIILDDTVDSANPVITVSGFSEAFTNTFITHTVTVDAHHSRYTAGEAVSATESARFTMSGTLSSEIDSDIATHASDVDAHHVRYIKDANDAIIGGTNVTVVSGSNIITISSAAGGGGEGDVSDALTGVDGITVLSGTPTESETTISGFRDEFISASGTLVSKTGDTMTGPLLLPDGTLSDPAIAFSSNSDTGFFLNNGNEVDIVIDAVTKLRVRSDATRFLDPIILPQGSTTTPSTRFAGDPIGRQSGIYRSSELQLAFLSDGEAAGRFDSNQALHVTGSGVFGDKIIAPSGIFAESLTVSGIPVVIDAHYTDAEAISALEPTTSALAASGVATDANIVAVSGHLSTEIDTDITTHAADTDAHHAKYTAAEAIADTEASRFTMSGTLSAEIDSDIVTHAAIVNAHHTKYTDSEAITALGPTTSALAASGVETDANIVAVSGHLSTEIDTDISTHAAIVNAHHDKYTDAEAITALGPTTSALVYIRKHAM